MGSQLGAQKASLLWTCWRLVALGHVFIGGALLATLRLLLTSLWHVLRLLLVLIVDQLNDGVNVLDGLVLLQRLLVHLLDTIGDQLLQLRHDDRGDTLDELLHLVETLLLVIHVHLLQLSNQITQDVILLVLEAADHRLPVDRFS